MPLSDDQMKRLEALSAKGSLSDEEMGELEALDRDAQPAAAPEPTGPGGYLGTAEELGVHTVETPQGPAQVTAAGVMVQDPEEHARLAKARDSARFRRVLLSRTLTALQGGGFDLADELSGLKSAIAGRTAPRTITSAPQPSEWERFVSDYRQGKAAASKVLGEAEAEAGSEWRLAGMVPQVAVGAPETAVGRVLFGGALGATQAAGASPADLTRGEVGPMAKDVGIGAGAGVVLSGAAEGLLRPVSAVASRVAEEADAAKAALFAKELQSLTQKGQSLQGTARSVTAQAVRRLEWMDDVLRNPDNYAPEVVLQAKRMAVDPEVIALRNATAGNTLSDLRGTLGYLQHAKEAASEALTGLTGKAEEAVSAKLAPEALRADLGGRAWRSIGQRTLLGAGGALVGSAVGSLTGAEGGGTKGGLVGAGLGFVAPGALQMMRNVAADPRYQHTALRAVGGALGVQRDIATQTATSLGRQSVRPKEDKDADAISAYLSGG